VNDSATTYEDLAARIAVLANDTDAGTGIRCSSRA
jgi:hypothetical protein